LGEEIIMSVRIKRGQRAPKVVLTDRFLRALRKKQKPTDREFTYDGQLPGLAVMRTSTGHMSFGTIRHWPGKKSKSWRRLGAVYVPTEDETLPDPNNQEIDGTVLTLAEARQKLRRWNDLLSRGIDPAGEARKRKVEATKRIAFPALRDAFLQHYEGKAKHRDATRILNKDFACWNHHLADEIDAQDVDAAIQVILRRGSKHQALNGFGYVRTMYNWAMGQPRLNIKASPCANLSAVLLIGKKRKRTRVLTDDEIRAIWEACEKDGFIYPYGQIVRLLLLTAVRESQIGRASRSELQNDENGAPMLVIPSLRMKGDHDAEPPPPHEIPLTPRMADIIASLPQWSGPYLFSHKGGKSPVNGWSGAKRRLDKLSGVTGWIYHDLRRTARTRISAIPAEEHVREALLAHGRRGIQAHYDQHKYRVEKRHLLQQWDDRLEKILNPLPPDVTDLDQHRAERGVAS
jgi:integrase